MIALRRIMTFLLSFLASLQMHAIEPDSEWRTMSTPHFTIIYDASMGELAKLYANYAEYSLIQLKPYFSEWPENTVIVLNDNTDQANGYATRLPRPLIHLNPVLPREGDSIGYFGHWSYELVLHEMVHIMTFEPANGVYTPLRAIFGSIASPLMLLPRWYLEGVAVELESRLSDFGRLRSPQIEAQIRAQIIEGRIGEFDIASINEVLNPDWPGGQRPYLFGAMVWHEMMESFSAGSTPLTEILNQRYSRRVPFLIDGPVEDELVHDYQKLLDSSFRRARFKVTEQRETLQKVPPTAMQVIHFEGCETRVQLSPKISPDGLSLAIVTHNMNNPNEILILQRESWTDSFVNAPIKHRIPIKGTFRLNWHPSAPLLVFDQVKKRGYYGTGFDLYSYDLTTKETKRLTRQRRAREPALNNRGDLLTIVAQAGRTQLVKTHLDRPDQVEVLLQSEFDQRFSNPLWKDETTVYFVSRGPNQASSLHSFNLNSGERQQILGPEWNVTHLSGHMEDITFSSPRSGVSNIYSLKGRAIEPLTHVEDGAFGSHFHSESNTLVSTYLSSLGEVVRQSRGPSSPLTLPQVKPFYRFPAISLEAPDTKFSEEKEYRGGPYLWPLYWMPFLQPYDDGVLFQAITAGADPLGHHSYTVTLSYDTFSETAGFGSIYSNTQSAYPWSAAVSDTSYLLRALDAIRHDRSQSLAVGFSKKDESRDWNYSLGVTNSTSDILNSSVYRAGPTFSLTYSDTSLKGKMIAPEKGKSLALATRHYLPQTSNLDYSQIQLNGSYYWSSFLPKRHSLALVSNLLYTPEDIPEIYGGTTASSPQSLIGGGFLMRGYQSGQFLGQNLWTAALEYRFPLRELESGFGTLPVFLRRMHSRLVVDALTMDGFALSKELVFEQTRRMERFFYGGGLEFYLDTNVGYSYPLTFFFGIYQPLNDEISSDPVLLINFLL